MYFQLEAVEFSLPKQIKSSAKDLNPFTIQVSFGETSAAFCRTLHFWRKKVFIYKAKSCFYFFFPVQQFKVDIYNKKWHKEQTFSNFNPLKFHPILLQPI